MMDHFPPSAQFFLGSFVDGAMAGVGDDEHSIVFNFRVLHSFSGAVSMG